MNGDLRLLLNRDDAAEELGGDEDWLSPHLTDTGHRINPITDPQLHQQTAPRNDPTRGVLGEWVQVALEDAGVKGAAQIRDRIQPAGLPLTPASSSASSQVGAESSSFGTHRNNKGATDG
ncbi:hypothetical protein ACFSBZ_16350 [Amnibacterium flavum]|uniref:hypothetical protein n=1 Tax=Amnibacterium flavum TaxID=2173173 RepID=UPI0010579E2C|nr:hypothetical protein [Amnibacterium flavum]